MALLLIYKMLMEVFGDQRIEIMLVLHVDVCIDHQQ